jgi:hypothetical protein
MEQFQLKKPGLRLLRSRESWRVQQVCASHEQSVSHRRASNGRASDAWISCMDLIGVHLMGVHLMYGSHAWIS